MTSKHNVVTLILGTVLLLLTNCTTAQSSLTPTETPSLATETPIPLKTLTICLGEEPGSLYPYGYLTASAREVLAAIYDGPIDTNAYGFQSVILEKLPSIADGDAILETVSLYIGDEIVDADGNPTTLAAGVRVHPSGCRSDECAVVYSGIGEIEMDQMVVNFSLLPGLVWADGEALTAEDSLYSYNLAADIETPGSKFIIERTYVYEVVDELTVQWWGKPGFIDPTYFTNYWMPLPEHLWEDFSAAELPAVDIAAQTPLGWGAYVIEEWLPGEHIRLVRNPRYFRVEEGLPYFDELYFRFTADPNAAVSELLDGDCDILAPSVGLDNEIGFLLAAESQGILQVEVAQTMTLELITFGIQPAVYDDGYSLYEGDRPDYFAEQRTRQALVQCMDRELVINTVLFGLSDVAQSLLPSDHPFFDSTAPQYAFDVSSAAALLDQVGWQDQDGDPATPRQAFNVAGVVDGTPLVLDYWTTNTVQRRQVGEILAGSLAQCGIGVDLHTFAYEDLFAPGPRGPVFGRQFELLQVGLGTTGVDTPCEWFTTEEIPGDENQWAGTNISGYSQTAFDSACQSLKRSRRDEAAHADAYNTLQMLLVEDVPFAPLFWRLQVGVAGTDICSFRLDPTASSSLWNIESIHLGEGCSQ